MLKIKDSVNLKELEKFGFKKIKDEFIEFYELNVSELENGFCGLVIYTNERIIDNYSNVDKNSLDIIYDLIQAGIVEKI